MVLKLDVDIAYREEGVWTDQIAPVLEFSSRGGGNRGGVVIKVRRSEHKGVGEVEELQRFRADFLASLGEGVAAGLDDILVWLNSFRGGEVDREGEVE